MNSEFRRGVLAATPLFFGLCPLAMILGAQASQAGQSFITAYLMTAFNLAGGSEFAVISMWSAVPPILMIVISTFLINSRHIILSASLAPYVQKESGLRIFFLYFVMCDETWAIVMQDLQRRQAENRGGFSWHYHMGVGLTLWLIWSWSACLGALIGNSFGDLSMWGFTMALPATFIGLSIGMRPRDDMKKYIPIVVSFIAAGLCTVYGSSTYSVGCGALSGLTTAYILEIWREKHLTPSALAQERKALEHKEHDHD